MELKIYFNWKYKSTFYYNSIEYIRYVDTNDEVHFIKVELNNDSGSIKDYKLFSELETEFIKQFHEKGAKYYPIKF